MPALYDESGSEDDLPSFGLNKDFAQAYETKKRNEELSKLQDKYGKDYTLSDEEDEEEDLSDDDSDAELVTPQVDAAILRTLAKIRQKDPSVYEEGREVFDEEEFRTASTSTLPAAPKSKATKPVLLKDYQRSRFLADPTDSLPDQPSAEGFFRTFAQEESDLKAEVTRAFHADASGSDDDAEDDLLVPRAKTKDEREKEDEEYARFLKANVGDREVEDALEQEEKFLRDYILNRGWIDRSGNKSRIPSYNEVTGGHSPPPEEKKKPKKEKKAATVASDAEADVEAIPDPGENDSEEDSEFDDRAEEFEHKYNFRFEEAAGPTIQTHSRTLAATTARRPTAVVSARARARDAAKEKKDEEKLQRKEEVRRLKSLKRKEVEDKLRKILEAAGTGAEGLDDVDLDGDWDPEAHDRKMAEIYGEGYVEAQDDEFKPAWDDDIDISDLQAAEDAEGGEHDDAYDPSASVGATKKARKDKGKRKRDEEGFPTELLEAAKNGGDEGRKALLESMVDEYYALDYEDKIGDLPTRFKYASVAPSSFSLTPAEILLATDAELNSYVSLRKMAPYRSSGEQAAKKAKDKKRLKELRDALKDREWGVELELDEDGEPVRKSKKPKWSEETGRTKREKPAKEAGAASGSAPAVKRVGKKERQRRKLAAEVDGATAGTEA